MLDRILRNIKEIVLHPFAEQAGKLLHPNMITLLSFGFGLVSIYFIIEKSLMTALVFWLLNRIFDGLDGTVARITGQSSDFGGYLDIVLDFIVYSAIPVAFVFSTQLQENYFILSVLLSSYYVNAASWMYLSSILEKRNLGATSNNEMTTITMPSGIADGTMTIIFYTLFFIIPSQLKLLFAVFIILVLISIVQRMVWAYVRIR
ncbi:MAG: CDP-alcohol phosphatidyltransferase [Spirochaetae bacterium HGW-Spirochaetae-5]|nr:MAG: CDP-alcohol phosphatidyltransferase [Spirochaetae bacterium HGW-Spirochaetae-5]